jgi:hypothetical protein
VGKFNALSSLEDEYVFLNGLKIETQLKVAKELRAAELRVEELCSTQARGRHEQEPTQNAPEVCIMRPKPAADAKASWDTLIVSQSLRETLQAYCRILRDYKGYQDTGAKQA